VQFSLSGRFSSNSLISLKKPPDFLAFKFLFSKFRELVGSFIVFARGLMRGPGNKIMWVTLPGTPLLPRTQIILN
jgi:hypothetical protein